MRQDDRPNDERLRRALEELGPPPPTPREAMWARIEAERGRAVRVAVPSQGAAPSRSPVPSRRAAPSRIPRVLGWGAALAATLAIGVALGREQIRRQVTGGTATGSSPALETAAGGSAEVPTAYRVAAAQHLQKTEALFASLAVDAPAGATDEVSGWARTLLTDTRLLLGSPAGADPALRALLEDLELVLSQIAMIPAAMAREEVELIQEGINRSDVLVRMRAASAGPGTVGPGTVSYQGRVDR